MKNPSISAIVQGLLFAVVAHQGALAQTVSTPREVTRDELRACMNSETDIAARRKGFEGRNAKNREDGAAIRAEAEELAEEQKRVADDSNRMERFNRKVRVHNEKVQVNRTNVDSLRTDTEALNKSVVAYNDKCGGISFKKEDKDAILKEREAVKN